MRSSDNQSSAPKSSHSHLSSIIPVSALKTLSTRSSGVSFEHPLTPDPSPSMNPQDLKNGNVAPFNMETLPTRSSPEHQPGILPSSSSKPQLGKGTSAGSSLSSSSSQRSYTLYTSATPPMSPAHTLLSPASQPCYNITDPNQHGSGFYQLPPPLQSFRPNDIPGQSLKMLQPQQSCQSGPPSLPPSRTSQPVGYNGVSPRSNPQQSPMHHPLSSPSIGPLSPYPTPQHHPQHHSSPHQSPRYEDTLPKQPVPPNMTLPASSFSSTSVFQVLSPRTYPAPYPTAQSVKSPASHGPQLKSPRNNVSQRSVPNSPRRFMMLPPETAPSMSTARQSATQAKATDGSSSKRRASSNAKAVDQETREMMRKVSHSAIERRRRERINDKILQLKHLVPACVDEDHLHKLSILQSTIEYVQYLKSIVPESVANAKLPKASNSNPNNKTTETLDAFNNPQSTDTFVPMMTTGLGHPYSKRVQVDQVVEQQDRIPSSTGSEATDPSQQSRRVSTAQSSSSEDAKDGLLLLSQISPVSMSVNTSPDLAPKSPTRQNVDADRRLDVSTIDHVGRRAEGSGSRSRSMEEVDDASDASDDLYDEEDYHDDEMMEESEGDDAKPKEEAKRRRSSGKMSVEQMLC